MWFARDSRKNQQRHYGRYKLVIAAAPFEADAKRKQSIGAVLLISAAAHCLIGAVLVLQGPMTTTPVMTTPITAKLVFSHRAAVQDDPAVEATVPLHNDSDAIKAEPKVLLPPTLPAERSAAPASPQTPLPGSIPALHGTQVGLQPAAQQPNKQNAHDTAKPSLDIRSLAQRHMQGIQQQQDQRFIQGQSEAFRQQRVSPDLNLAHQQAFMSEDEKFLQQRTISVDCDNSAAKTLSILSKLVGGTLKCSQPPSVAPFIQRRLNKQSDLESK